MNVLCCNLDLHRGRTAKLLFEPIRIDHQQMSISAFGVCAPGMILLWITFVLHVVFVSRAPGKGDGRGIGPFSRATNACVCRGIGL